MTRCTQTSLNHQRGVVLVVGMVLLVVMTLIGLTGIKLATADERMVAQSYDRSLAFQAAESALREAEIWIESSGKPEPVAGSACSEQGITPPLVQICGQQANAADTPRWLDSTFTDWSDSSSVGTTTLALTPQYFVEYLGNNYNCSLHLDPIAPLDCKRYRITARVNAGEGRSSVVLQSIYVTY